MSRLSRDRRLARLVQQSAADPAHHPDRPPARLRPRARIVRYRLGSHAIGPPRRVPIALTSGLALKPWATMLRITVQPAASMIVSLPGSFASNTRTANTIV